MATYEFRCSCGAQRVITASIHLATPGPPICVCGAHMRRVFHAPSIVKGITNVDPHYNNSLGMPISSMAEFRSELSRKSEEMAARTGLPVNLQPLPAGERAPGVTDEHKDLQRERDLRTGRADPKVIVA